MKIGVIADSMVSTGYGRYGKNVYNKLKEYGFSCSDFNMMSTGTVLYKGEESEVNELLVTERKLADMAGIEISQVHGPWTMPIREVTPEGMQERMEKMKKSIRLTSVLGVKNWVIHPIMPYGLEEKETELDPKTFESNFKFFTQLLETAKDCGVTICLENMPFENFSLSTPENILNLVNEINDDNFKICLDTGHVGTFADLNLADETRRLGNKIMALHVHDTRPGADLHQMPYYGSLDWESFAGALKDIGFDGTFSLETTPLSKLPEDIFVSASLLLNQIAEKIVSESGLMSLLNEN